MTPPNSIKTLIPRGKLWSAQHDSAVKYVMRLSHHWKACFGGILNMMLNIYWAPIICQETRSTDIILVLAITSIWGVIVYFFTFVSTESHRDLKKMSGQMSHGRKKRDKIYTQVFNDKAYALSTWPHAVSTMTKIMTNSLLSCSVKYLRKVDFIHWVHFLPSALSLIYCSLISGPTRGWIMPPYNYMLEA